MNIRLLLIVFLLSSFTILTAQNHMDIMTAMTGEHDASYLGWIMTSLDWNGDGYDDLIINEKGWKPPDNTDLYSYGKILAYFGGTSFDNIPEISIPGHYHWEYTRTIAMCNARHFNSDNYDDLALVKSTPFENGNDQAFDIQLCVYNGSANPDSIPDYILTFPREQWDNGFAVLASLGDINHDGFDDIGYVMGPTPNSTPNYFGVVYGRTMENDLLFRAGSQYDYAFINGVGDVNGDHFDDFMIGYSYEVNTIHYFKDVLYFGNASGIYADSLVIADGTDINSPNSFAAGDINHDGFAEFVSAYSSSNAKLFLGSANFDASNYMCLTPPYQGGVRGRGFSHGDVNGNGTDDLMGSSFSWANGDGEAGFWEGGVPMNGGLDLQIESPVQSWLGMFGWCLTMGDYNGDGCCDAAISAPFDVHGGYYLAYVYVYAGNPDLHDPLPVSDDTETPAISRMQLYPNPLQPQNSDLNVRFTETPLSPLSRGDLVTFDIYNIRGQIVKSFIITVEQSKSGSAHFRLNDLSSGVYVCVLTDDKQQIKGKITIMK